MNFEDKILFFLSALGAFNGLFLSFYFAFFIKNKSKATYFIAALLFVISVRVTKTVFFTYYPDTSSAFVGLGLTACFLIGPFLFLHVKESLKPNSFNKWTWIPHTVPVVVFMIIISIFFPYNENARLWNLTKLKPFGVLLFSQWTIYLFTTIYHTRLSFKKVFFKSEKISSLDFWLVNIVIGVFLIWLAYNTITYTSYIAGALSFSFTFYVSLIIWFLKRKKNTLSFLTPELKYANKKIDSSKAKIIADVLKTLFEEKKIHLNRDLKINDVAIVLQIPSHSLSQYLNDNVGQSFSNFVNGYRLESAIKMFYSNKVLSIEGIGNECGFKSNTSFYNAFKKHKGMTPAQFKRSI